MFKFSEEKRNCSDISFTRTRFTAATIRILLDIPFHLQPLFPPRRVEKVDFNSETSLKEYFEEGGVVLENRNMET